MSIQHIAFIFNSSLSYPDEIIKTRNKTKHTKNPTKTYYHWEPTGGTELLLVQDLSALVLSLSVHQ